MRELRMCLFAFFEKKNESKAGGGTLMCSLNLGIAAEAGAELGLMPATRNSILVSHVGDRTNYLSQHLCIPRCASAGSWRQEQGLGMGVRYSGMGHGCQFCHKCAPSRLFAFARPAPAVEI